MTSEVSARLESGDNLINRLEKLGSSPIVRKLHNRDGSNCNHVPEKVRELIGVLAHDDTKTAVAEEFNVSIGSVSKYSDGLVSNRLDENLVKATDKKREDKKTEAHDLAVDALMSTLENLTPKLKDAELKPKELSKIAVDMSRVTANLKPPVKEEETAKVQVVLMSVGQRKENEYETIDV